jgi:hypothetical protein
MKDVAKELFRGIKDTSLTNNQESLNLRMGTEPARSIIIEAIIQRMQAGDGFFIQRVINDSQIAEVLMHPGIAQVEACDVNPSVLLMAQGMKVNFHVNPMRSAAAFSDNFKEWIYIRAGYDWKLLPILCGYFNDNQPSGSLASYMVDHLTPVDGLSSESGAFWSASALPGEGEICRNTVQAIAEVDPIGFKEAFELLTNEQKLACVAIGFADRKWVDMETIPQAGLANMLEIDLGL